MIQSERRIGGRREGKEEKLVFILNQGRKDHTDPLYFSARRSLSDRRKSPLAAGYRHAFEVPGLTGVWCMRQEGRQLRWHATVITRLGIFDSQECGSPWAALEAVRRIVKDHEE